MSIEELTGKSVMAALGVLAILFVAGCATYRSLSPAAPGYRETNSSALCDSLTPGAPVEITLKSGKHVIGSLESVDADEVVISRSGAGSRQKTVFARADIAVVATATGQPESAYTAATVMFLLAAFFGAIWWSMGAGGGS